MENPGRGFRNLRPGERIPEGGEFYGWRGDGRQWIPSLRVGCIPPDRLLYRCPDTKTPRKSPKLRETSLQAHRSQKGKAPLDRVAILARLRKYRTGTTCDKLEQVLNMSHQTTSARINDLVRLGKVVDSGRREKTRTGRLAICWKAVA